jgi:hypothetical protein
MTDRIENIVEKALLYTEEILAAAAADWSVARIGLSKMAANIRNAAPDHPALQTLVRYIEENDARYGAGAGRG